MITHGHSPTWKLTIGQLRRTRQGQVRFTLQMGVLRKQAMVPMTLLVAYMVDAPLGAPASHD